MTSVVIGRRQASSKPAKRSVDKDLFGRRIRKAPPAPERKTHIAIADMLRHDCRRDWWWTHFPSGELRTDATGGLLKRMGLKSGVADFLLISPVGIPHWMELKRENLGQLFDDQEDFRDLCLRTGMPWALVRNFDEAKAQLEVWSILRGRLTAW